MTKDLSKDSALETRSRPANRFYENCRHWTGDWGGKLTLIFGLLTLAQLFYFRYRWGGKAYLDIVTDIIPILIYFGAFLLALRVSRQRTLPVRTRRAWRLLAFAHLFYMAGSVLWAYFELITHTKPFPSWADAAYLSYYPLMLAGLLLLVSKRKTLEERVKLALDSGIVTLGGGMLIWYFLLQPIAQAATGNRLLTVLSLAYPVSDIVLLFGISAVLIRRSAWTNRWALNFLLAGIGLTFIADLIFGYENLSGTYQSSMGSYGLYTLSCFLVILASHVQYTRPSFEVKMAASFQREIKSFIWLPYLSIALAYGLLLKFVYEHPHTLLSQLIVAAAALTVFVVSRQVMALRENAKGRNALRELQERFQGIYSASKDAIVFSSFDGTILEVNDACATLIGYSKEELLQGTKYQQLTAPEYHEFEREIRARVIESGEPAEYEKEAIRKDGARLAVAMTTFAVKGNDGNPIGLASIVRDVTEPKRAQAEHRVISDIVQGVLTTTNLDELLNLAHRSIGTFLYAENCFVALHDPATDLLHWDFWVDKVDPLPAPEPVGEGFTSYVLRTGQPLLLTEKLKARMYEEGKFTKSGSDSPSWLGVPLRTPARTIGVLAVQHYEKENVYCQHDLEFLSSVGDQIALAIERKRAEEKLKRSEARLAEAQQVAHVGSWEWDVITKQVIWSDEEYRLFGLVPGERAASHELYLSCVHPDFRKDAVGWVKAVIANKKSSRLDLRIIRPDGEERILQSWANAVLDERGDVVRVIGTSQDITEEKEAERALATSEERTRLVVATAHDAFIGMDSAGLISDWNPRAEATFGWSHEEAIGQPMTELIIPPKFREMHVRGLKHFLATGEGPVLNKLIEVSAIHRDGHEIPIELMISPIRIGDSFIFSASLRDITERKRMENELTQARDAALESARLKSEFLANMSHEIRTPMNGIIGMTELTLETDLNRVQREYLGMVQSSAHSLLDLINDILDFSKIEAGHLKLESIDFSVRDCVGKTLETFGVRAHAKGLELATRTDPQIPDTLVGDAARLRQIITNLVDNAIKFTARGQIVVEINCESRDATEVCLHVTVRDTGVGIPKDKQGLIFEAFIQADGSTTRHYGGTGLGLGICTKIVEQMHGKIWVESTLGAGSTFHFTAHFPLSKTRTSSTETQATVRGLRVLVVDDNATNRRILHEMLSNWEMIPLLVTSAHEAMTEVEAASDSDWEFDLVLVDAMMPQTDGFSLAKQLRNASGTASAPIIMLSSSVRPGDDARAQTAGISAVLTKPVQQSVLLDAIQKAIEQKAGAPSTSQAAPEDFPASKPLSRALRIMVAEDNVINRAVAAGILEKQGHSLVHAANGREVLRALEDASFDLIFMDVQMPEMDGFEATRRIREMEQSNGHRTPIIAMTAHAMTGDRERCLAAGMDDYVSKPLKKEDVLKILDAIPKSVSSSISASNGRASSQCAIPSGANLQAAVIFNREELLEQCDGDEKLMEHLILLFNENTPQILDSVRHSIAKRDAGALAASAHKLLSSLGAFGAAPARDLALSLEKQGREADLGGANESFVELEREINEIYIALGDYAGALT